MIDYRVIGAHVLPSSRDAAQGARHLPDHRLLILFSGRARASASTRDIATASVARSRALSTPDQAAGVALADVAIVGAGLAGALAAIDLARQGCTVTLIERQAQPRHEFRAEQLVGRQIAQLDQHGVLAGMVGRARPQRTTLTARAGRVIAVTAVDQFGLSYQDMVTAVRAAVPAQVRRVTGRVVGLATGAARQEAVLADGATVPARLLVLATGLPTALARDAGVVFRTVRANHSLTLGFDLAGPASGLATRPLVYYPPTTQERLDYFALFVMGDRLRANLFCYHAPESDWVRAFRCDPTERLRALLPGLDRVLGPVDVTSPVEVRNNDLRIAADPARDGVVLLGDAFQTPCPSAGTGIDRLLSDVAALGRRVPDWLATPGMGRDKIAAFYADPGKRAADAEALRIAEYRRAVSTETSLGWRFHRAHVDLRRRLRALTLFPTPAGPPSMAPSA